MKRLIYILTGLVVLTACNNDDSQDGRNNKRVPLEIAACIDLQTQAATRAAESHWEDNDKIGVFITSFHTTNIFVDGDGTRAENMEYTFGDTNYETYETSQNIYRLFNPTSKKIYLSSTSVDVYGYYPYSSTKKDGSTKVDPKAIEINVSDQSDQTAIDLMRAKTEQVDNTQNSIKLLFSHKMVKLVFNLRQGDGLLTDELKNSTISNFTINNQPTEATYNLYTDVMSITDGSTTITPKKMPDESIPSGYDLTYEAIVLPNNLSNNPATNRTVTITFYTKNTDTITNTFTIGAGTSFDAGFKYVYNVTVNATSIAVNEDKYTTQW